jgi:hypothetical protein
LNRLTTLLLWLTLSVSLKAQITLGSTVGTFGVLAGTTVTNTGPTVAIGNVGVSPGSAITGFPPGSVTGTIHSADGLAGTAQTELTTAYNSVAAAGPSTTIAAALGGLTFFPGVYNTGSSFGLTGTVTLDALGNPNAQFIFQAATTLTTASNSTVLLINGAQASNVFWKVGSSATLGTNSFFSGNILALTTITLTTGSSLQGRALARNGAVTLDTNTVTTPMGLGGPPPPLGTPAPSSLILVTTALLGVFVYQGRKKIFKPFITG